MSPKKGFEISFQWIPAHVGLSGNVIADGRAKRALTFDCVFHESENTSGCTVDDALAFVDEWIRGAWRGEWGRSDVARGFRLLGLIPNPGLFWSGKTRKGEVMVRRLRLGKARFNQVPGQNVCACGRRLTIPHFLFGCRLLSEPRGVYRSRIGELGPGLWNLRGLLNPPIPIRSEVFGALLKYIRDSKFLDQI